VEVIVNAIIVELRSFKPPPPLLHNNTQYLLNASMGRMMLAAATVGLSTWALTPGGTYSARSLDELRWRAYMLKANLKSTGAQWGKSDSYLSLDPTEKGAVSYFHGMAQAALVLDRVLDLPYTAHIDACLLAIGQPLKESRPDLIAFRATGQPAAAVECKGRTGSHDKATITNAKVQAGNLPKVLGCPTTTPIASISHFDRASGSWSSLMVDPEPGQDRPEIPIEAVAFAHYWPLVTLANSMAPLVSRGQRTWATDSISGFSIGVPTSIMNIFSRYDLISSGARQEAGIEILSLAENGELLGEPDFVPGVDNFGEAEYEADGCGLLLAEEGLEYFG
jgi:hypothetical protein